MKFKVYSSPLPEVVCFSSGHDEVLQTFLMRICFEYILAHYSDILHRGKTYGLIDEQDLLLEVLFVILTGPE